MHYSKQVYVLCQLFFSSVMNIETTSLRFKQRPGLRMDPLFMSVEYVVGSLTTCCSLCRPEQCWSVSWHEASGRCQLCIYHTTHTSEEYKYWLKVSGWVTYHQVEPRVEFKKSDEKWDINYEEAGDICAQAFATIASEQDLRNAWNDGHHECRCGWYAGGLKASLAQYYDLSCYTNFYIGFSRCNYKFTMPFVWCKY